jgi:hypothetical protein
MVDDPGGGLRMKCITGCRHSCTPRTIFAGGIGIGLVERNLHEKVFGGSEVVGARERDPLAAVRRRC